VAYGALLRDGLLAVPPRGWVNLHFSLLPAWRGAAPVQAAVAAGDTITGATTFQIEPSLDSGPVYGVVTETIQPSDTSGDLLERLAISGAALLSATLDGIGDGTLTPRPQPADGVSIAPKITVEEARVRWELPAPVVERRIRAVTPNPGAWTMIDDLRIKLGPVQIEADAPESLPPGVIHVDRKSVWIGTSRGLSRFRPSATPAPNISPAVVFTSVKLGDKTVDPARSLVPLPIDLLADAKGNISLLAACTFAGSTLSADGKQCATAAATAQAAGFTAIDGFSTTGAILGPTSELIDATTITGNTLRLYDLSDPAHPTQVDATTYIPEPCEFTSGCPATPGGAAPQPQLSTVIAIQPAGASQSNPGSVFTTKPLKDATTYAVVMTNGILDKASQPLRPGTVAQILRFTNPLTVDGKSALQGTDDATAASLEAMMGSAWHSSPR